RHSCAMMVVNVLVFAVDPRNNQGCAKVLGETVVEGGEEITVDGANFVVMMRNLAHGNIPRAGTRLVLINVFIAQVGPQAGLIPDALHAPIGIDQTESGSARSD